MMDMKVEDVGLSPIVGEMSGSMVKKVFGSKLKI